ncbi:hypothetical protein SDC9_107655 [bioreactor metagenome]|uniref:Uncharacterized protein n=1 Tax=bioreactor metagenome TaxID=1076179 RepID=A0A645B864_9ZZZZ
MARKVCGMLTPYLIALCDTLKRNKISTPIAGRDVFGLLETLDAVQIHESQ